MQTTLAQISVAEHLLDRYRTGGPRPLFGYCEAEDTIADRAVSAAVLNLLKTWYLDDRIDLLPGIEGPRCL